MAKQEATVAWEPRTKFSANDLGDPRVVLNNAVEDKTVVLLGTVIGNVNGVVYKHNPNKPEQASVALTGVFEGIPSNSLRAVMRSAVVFLPEAINELIVKAITKGKPVPKGAMGLKRGMSIPVEGEGVIPIAVEIGVRRSSSPIGYEYVSKVIGDAMETSDPLADLRSTVKLAPRSEQLQIAAPQKPAKAKRK